MYRLDGEHMAYKDGKMYEVYVSKDSTMSGGYLGRDRIVKDNQDNIIARFFCSQFSNGFEIISDEKLEDLKNKYKALIKFKKK